MEKADITIRFSREALDGLVETFNAADVRSLADPRFRVTLSWQDMGRGEGMLCGTLNTVEEDTSIC